VPERATDWGLVDALWVTVNVAVRLPKAEGVNVTLMLQLFPAPSVLGLRGQFPLQTKSAGAVPPPMAILLMVIATVWVFLNVAVAGALAMPTAWLPKDMLEGVSLVCADADEPRRTTEAAMTTLNQ
jgi:hypothetical protein